MGPGALQAAVPGFLVRHVPARETRARDGPSAGHTTWPAGRGWAARGVTHGVWRTLPLAEWFYYKRRSIGVDLDARHCRRALI